MKNIIVTVLLILGIISVARSQNMITAGQTNGTNIHYTDYIPDSSIYLGQNYNGFKLDLDKNGTDDLLLNMGVINWGPPDLWTWSTIKILKENIKICLSADTLNWVYRFDAGDTISGNKIWSSDIDSVYYFQKYSSWSYAPPGGDTTEGYFGFGYLGFQMNYPNETFFGWINVEATNFTLTTKESAIQGITVGNREFNSSNRQINIYPNPFVDLLTIQLNSKNYFNPKIELLDLYGKIIESENIVSDISRIHTSYLVPGMYLVSIIESDRIIYRIKVIKK